jgi:hypothetical protein
MLPLDISVVCIMPLLPFDASIQQQPMLPLDMSALQQPLPPFDASIQQQPILPLDISVLQQPVLPFSACIQQQPMMLPLDVTVQQQHLLPLDVSVLKQTLLPGCVYSIAVLPLVCLFCSCTADCAASGVHFHQHPLPVLPGRVFLTAACASSRRICSKVACAALGSVCPSAA